MSITSVNHDQERFDDWAKTYEHSFMQWLLFDRVHRAVLRQLPAGFTPGSILDIGCGTGRLLRRMHARWPNADLVGIDLSEEMVCIAHQLTPNASIYLAPAEQLPIKQASVDLVITTMSFHHWSDQTQAAQEISRVLRHAGIFALADTNIGHGHPLSRSQVRELFETSGFSLYSQTSFVPYLTITVGEKS